MPFITEFMSPTGETLPIAAATRYTVRIPAAGSEELYGWVPSTGGYLRQISRDWIYDGLAVQAIDVTADTLADHGLRITLDDGLMELELTTLPEAATTLHLLVQNAVDGGEL